MHELTCPGCGSASAFHFEDYLYQCPFCSATFKVEHESGRKEIFSDHYIVPNTLEPARAKQQVVEWIRRVHHKPGAVDKEFFVSNMTGISIPFWVISVEIHTTWKGLVERQKRFTDQRLGTEYLPEKGTFRRSYRWAISARNNICEYWGLARLHEPKEPVAVTWDGFPLDSTFSRGRLEAGQENEKLAYDRREFFEFKYSNGVSILGIQVDEEEALRRARTHLELYHYNLAKAHTQFLVDCRHEFDLAGIQLIHLPFWMVEYVYKPASALRYVYTQHQKKIVLEGITGGILKSELAIRHSEKAWVNTLVCASASVVFFFLGVFWHQIFLLVALFFVGVAGYSSYVSLVEKDKNAAATAAQPA